jgi:hypothetical protein
MVSRRAYLEHPGRGVFILGRNGNEKNRLTFFVVERPSAGQLTGNAGSCILSLMMTPEGNILT